MTLKDHLSIAANYDHAICLSPNEVRRVLALLAAVKPVLDCLDLDPGENADIDALVAAIAAMEAP